MSPELRASQALSILEQVVAAMCLNPAKMTMDVITTNTSIRIHFTVANGSDSRRLVGKGGDCVGAIDTLARLMLQRLKKVVNIEKIDCLTEERVEQATFKPNPEWPKARIEKLLLDAAACCFPEQRIQVRSRDTKETKDGTEMKVVLQTLDHNGLQFGRAVAILFKPIGNNNGRKLFADVEEGKNGNIKSNGKATALESRQH